ncbi:MAG: sugar phosphate isomerase/epimerase [Firmicutes bacterium]|nr:sugar phosphate isomerase/epimerase [Bacillota bacterium]
MYKTGICYGLGNGTDRIDTFLRSYETILKAGFDYVESSVPALISLTPSEVARLNSEGVKIEAANGFIPGTFSLFDPAQRSEVNAHVERAAERAAELGIEYVVFGSGAFRRSPDGVSPDDAYKIFVEFTRHAGDVFDRYGRKIAIEPLRPEETNIINSVASCAKAVIDIASPAVWVLADSYHMLSINEDLSVLSRCESMLRHIHVADGADRRRPGINRDNYLVKFGDTIRKSGYSGRISVEAGGFNIENEGADCHNFLVEIFG